MLMEQCWLGVCFVPLDGSGQKFFGFSEFLAGLALMILAWTIADVRYRFRISTAPIPLQRITFSVVVVVGTLTLLTDLWRAEQWLVPEGSVLSPPAWQALLGGLFLMTFLTWSWFAFIRPPIYRRHNSKRFAHTLYRLILKGAPTELPVIADELTRSAESLIHHATHRKNYLLNENRKNDTSPPKVAAYANDLLLLIADKRFCRAIVESSPDTALAIFQAMAKMKKYDINILVFAKNIVTEALANRDSFIYHETEGYESGLIGYHKPLSQALFANYKLVDTVGTLLDPDFHSKQSWDSTQWDAYCRIALISFRGYVDAGCIDNSVVIHRAMSYIENAASDLYTLNERPGTWDTDPIRRLRASVKFIQNATETLDRISIPDHIRTRIRGNNGHPNRSFYDHIASMIFEVIFHASAITSPRWECWSVQHNTVWGKLFNFDQLDYPAGRVVKFKVRRLLYNEISEMTRFANFKGARIISFCLNVMGLTTKGVDHDKDSRALHRALLSWVRNNYIWLHEHNPHVAGACLVEGITYDSENRRLVKTWPADRLMREPRYDYLELSPSSKDLRESKPATDGAS